MYSYETTQQSTRTKLTSHAHAHTHTHTHTHTHHHHIINDKILVGQNKSWWDKINLGGTK
jgi:hypothetical protein